MHRLMFLMIVLCWSSGLAQSLGSIDALPGSANMTAHGGGVKTFRDHTGRELFLSEVGNGLSVHRNSHGETGIVKDRLDTGVNERASRLEVETDLEKRLHQVETPLHPFGVKSNP